MKKILVFLFCLILFGCYKKHKKELISVIEPEYPDNIECYEVDMKWWRQVYISDLFVELYKLERTKKIKDSLEQKEEIRKLNISSHNLKTLPKDLFLFKNLEALDISNNQFEDLEGLMFDLSRMPKLKLLVMSHCGFQELPDNIKLLKNLEGLVLDQNKLKVVNENIGELTNLRYLSFRRNKLLKDLPKSIGSLKCLEQLTISGAGFTRVRDEVSNCISLKSLIANASKIEFVTDSIGKLINLRNLNLGSNKIKKLPSSIGNLIELEDIHIGSNEISELPTSIGSLKNLELLSIEYNRFKSFPENLEGLETLRMLAVHNNNIPNIPIKIADLPKLKILYVDNEIISDQNIQELRKKNSNLEVKKHDAMRRAPGEPKRKN